MKDFVAEGFPLDFVQFGDFLKGGWILGDEGAFLEQRDDVLQIRFLGELFDIVEEGIAGNAGERVLNPIRMRELALWFPSSLLE